MFEKLQEQFYIGFRGFECVPDHFWCSKNYHERFLKKLKNVDVLWFSVFSFWIFVHVVFCSLFSQLKFIESLYEPSRQWWLVEWFASCSLRAIPGQWCFCCNWGAEESVAWQHWKRFLRIFLELVSTYTVLRSPTTSSGTLECKDWCHMTRRKCVRSLCTTSNFLFFFDFV